CFDDASDTRQEVGRRAVVDRDRDRAVQQTAPEREDPLGTVLAPEQNLVSLADAGLLQPRGEAPRGGSGLVVRVCTGAEPVVVDEKVALPAGKIVKEIK